jgi:hypothetical protein
MPMTSYLRKALGDESIGKAAFAMPAAIYVSLFTASPGDAGSLANEVAGGGYTRVEATTKMGVFNLSTGIATNTSSIDFANPVTDWGTVTYAGIVDAAAAGNLLYYEALPSPRTVTGGGRHVQFAVGSLQIRII